MKIVAAIPLSLGLLLSLSCGAIAQTASILLKPFETWTVHYVMPGDAFDSAAITHAGQDPTPDFVGESSDSFHGIRSWLPVMREVDLSVFEQEFSIQRESLSMEIAELSFATEMATDRPRFRDIPSFSRSPKSDAAFLDFPTEAPFDTHYLIDRMVYYVTPPAIEIPAVETSVVPEPTALSLLLVGICVMRFAKRR